MYYGGGLVSLLVLILDIYIIMQILKAGGDPGKQLLWIILVIALPLLGAILYYVVGPGAGRSPL
jgi:hypothetical protein